MIYEEIKCFNVWHFAIVYFKGKSCSNVFVSVISLYLQISANAFCTCNSQSIFLAHIQELFAQISKKNKIKLKGRSMTSRNCNTDRNTERNSVATVPVFFWGSGWDGANFLHSSPRGAALLHLWIKVC